MGAPLRLSVLDQSPIRRGGTAAQAVAETLELAELCDRLGYHRYWLAEHHSSEALAGSTPEVLITRVAGLTRRMRIGSGGVMLPHYSASRWRKISACWRRCFQVASISASAARPAATSAPCAS